MCSELRVGEQWCYRYADPILFKNGNELQYPHAAARAKLPVLRQSEHLQLRGHVIGSRIATRGQRSSESSRSTRPVADAAGLATQATATMGIAVCPGV
jgi:hypothetical protein